MPPSGGGFPANKFGASVFAQHDGSTVRQVKVGEVQSEDLAGAGSAVVQQPLEGLVPDWWAPMCCAFVRSTRCGK